MLRVLIALVHHPQQHTPTHTNADSRASLSLPPHHKHTHSVVSQQHAHTDSASLPRSASTPALPALAASAQGSPSPAPTHAFPLPLSLHSAQDRVKAALFVTEAITHLAMQNLQRLSAVWETLSDFLLQLVTAQSQGAHTCLRCLLLTRLIAFTPQLPPRPRCLIAVLAACCYWPWRRARSLTAVITACLVAHFTSPHARISPAASFARARSRRTPHPHTNTGRQGARHTRTPSRVCGV